MPVYGNFPTVAVDEYLTGKTLKALLVDDTYVPDVDHDFRDDITGEISGTGYTAGGETLTGVAVSYDGASDSIIITCDDIDFGTLTVTGVAGLVIYVSTGTDTTDQLLSVDIFDEPIDATAENFTYTVDPATGIIVGSVG